MVEFDTRHGGAFDRGTADSYYGRPRNPHYFEGMTYQSKMIGKGNMTEAELHAYDAGYDYNEEIGNKKDWGL
jgi:hypothetical protein